MLRITRMGPTDRREQWGNRNVDRESVNRRLLIAKLLDICLLLFQIRFQTIPLMLTRPNSVHSAVHERFSNRVDPNSNSLLNQIARFFPPSLLLLSYFSRNAFVKSVGKFPFRCSVSSTTSSSSSPPEINGGALANKPRRTREGENRVGGRCYAVCITDVIKITEVRAAMHNGWCMRGWIRATRLRNPCRGGYPQKSCPFRVPISLWCRSSAEKFSRFFIVLSRVSLSHCASWGRRWGLLDRSSLSIKILERTRSKNYRGKEICCVSISLFLDFGGIFFYNNLSVTWLGTTGFFEKWLRYSRACELSMKDFHGGIKKVEAYLYVTRQFEMFIGGDTYLFVKL